ncbi:hypothetical protein pb186bvf_014755 [Paramecium bursaria]
MYILINQRIMINPKKSSRDIWSKLGPQLKSQIKQCQEEQSLWGQIVDSSKKKLSQVSQEQLKSQRSISDYNTQRSRPMVRTFLEDLDQDVQDVEQQLKEWQKLAQEFSPPKKTSERTLSPICRLKSNINESIKIESCKLQGHENNQIRFICTSQECPYRFHKACAHCVIKLHSKHIDQMKELDQFEQQIEDNYKKAGELIQLSSKLMQKLQFPFEDFFSGLKEALIQVIDDVERRLVNKNKEKIQKLIKQEVEFINNFNQKYEQRDKNFIFSDEILTQYQQQITIANDKLRNPFNIEELKTLVETNLTLLFQENQQRGSQTSRTGRQPMDQSPFRVKSFHLSQILSPRSPLNVFNQNIAQRQPNNKINN